MVFPGETTRQYAPAREGSRDRPQVAGTNPGLLAVTARHDGTQVTITPKAATPAAQGAPAFAANQPSTVTLNAGDVIEIATRTGLNLTDIIN